MERVCVTTPEDTGRAHISLVGIGTVGTMQLTHEADAVLRAARVLYVLHAQSLVLDYLRERYDADVVDLSTAYEEDKLRNQTYNEIAHTVLDGAIQDGGRRVAYVTSGHPLVLVTPAQLILKDANEKAITVEVIPGVSSLDTVWADLRFDPGPDGALMFEATSLLLRRYPLIPTVPLFLWQVNSVETALYSTHKNKPERFARLQDYLLRYYPDDHVGKLVHSASFPITRAEIVSVALGKLGVLADVATSQHILYVPPVGRKPIIDKTLRAATSSVEHLHGLIAML